MEFTNIHEVKNIPIPVQNEEHEHKMRLRSPPPSVYLDSSMTAARLIFVVVAALGAEGRR